MRSVPETMAAVELEYGRGVQLVNRDVPRLEDEQVLVEIAYAGICGSDLHILQGTSRYASRVILGHESAGRVAAWGNGVPARFSLGDAVALNPQFSCGRCSQCQRGRPNFCENGGYSSTLGYFRDGCFAEYCVVHWTQVHRVPAPLGLERAVLCEPFNCILNGWKKLGEPPRDSRILIMGAGIFGLLWASLLHARGYRNAVITEPLEGRFRIASALCDERLNGYRVRMPASLGDERFDAVIECCGQAGAVADAYRRLDIGGRLLIFGGPPRGSSITIDPSEILFKELTLCGSVIGQHTFEDGIVTLCELADAGYLGLEELGVKKFALSDYADAIRAAEQGVVTRAVLVVAPES